MKNHTTLYVSPVPRMPSQGRDKQRFSVIDPKTKELTVTKSLNKTREVGTSVTLKFPLDHLTNRYVTGLDELIPNPFYGLEVDVVYSNHNLSPRWMDAIGKIVKQQMISRQTYYEIIDGVEPDHYTTVAKNGTMLNFQPNQLFNREPTFIEKFSVEFFDRPNRFTDDTPRQRMAMQLIKIHNRIAKSKEEANPAEHLFYISEENEAEMEKMRKQDIIDAALYEKVKLQREASEFMNYKVASLLTTYQGRNIIKGSETRDTVKQALNNYLNDRTHQLPNMEKFMKIIDMLKTPEGKQRFEVMYLAQQGLNTRVLEIRDGYLFWLSRSSTKDKYKWADYEGFISFILSEMLIFDPEAESSMTNWYGELYNEVKSKNAWVE